MKILRTVGHCLFPYSPRSPRDPAFWTILGGLITLLGLLGATGDQPMTVLVAVLGVIACGAARWIATNPEYVIVYPDSEIEDPEDQHE